MNNLETTSFQDSVSVNLMLDGKMYIIKESLNSPIYCFCIKLNIIREVPNFILSNAL